LQLQQKEYLQANLRRNLNYTTKSKVVFLLYLV